jgi:hypothetical protein
LDSQKISRGRAFGKVDKRRMILVGSPNLGGWRSSAVARKRVAPQCRSQVGEPRRVAPQRRGKKLADSEVGSLAT